MKTYPSFLKKQKKPVQGRQKNRVMVFGLLLMATAILMPAQGFAETPLLDIDADAKAKETTDSPAAASNSVYDQAVAYFKEKQYDETIKLIEGTVRSNPFDFKSNLLLGQALVEKCAQLKASGDSSYKQLVMRPYRIGLQLYQSAPTQPDPLYLIAKSLQINNRPRKAGKTIKKAMYYASPSSSNYPDYLVVLGDCWSDLLAQGDFRGYKSAKETYQQALGLRQDDAGFAEMIEQRLQLLESRHR